jgi:peptide/nickel transport system substrate-binding protein
MKEVRMGFGARQVATVAVTLSCVLGVSACGGSGSSGSQTGSGSTSGSPSAQMKLTTLTPAAKGTVADVTWGLATGEPTTLDPIKTGDYSPNTVVENLCDNLLQLQPDFSIKPGLAERYLQPNPTTVVLDIRPGVKFWDGHALTAADVVYSLKRTASPTDGSVNGSEFASVKSITQTEPLQVTIKFKAPDSGFKAAMASVTGAITEQAYTEQEGKRFGTPEGGVMCTGPFKLVKWTAGQQIQLTANDDYWDKALRPKVKNLTFKFFTDSSTLTSALLSGEVDGAYEAPVGSTKAFENSSVGKLYTGPSTASVSFGPTTATGPAANPLVRQALDLAINKEAFINNDLDGEGARVKTFTPPYVYAGLAAKKIYQAGYNALPNDLTPNLTEARKLIKEAHPGKAALVIAIPAGDQLSLEEASIIQAAGQSIGLNMSIKQLQPTAFSNLFYSASERAGTAFVATSGYIETPSPLYYAPLFALSSGPFNWSHYSNPTVTKYLNAAEAATNETASAEDFVKAQAAFAPARLQVSLAVEYERLFMNDKITGAPASFAYISSPWAARLGAAQ